MELPKPSGTCVKPRFYAFWAINAPLEPARLRRQLEQFHALGLDGVVWHPRFYPGEPPYLGDRYLAEVSEVILHAKSLGLAFWLYDEDGWPSGTVGGQLLKRFPDDAQRWADLTAEKPERCLAEFEVRNSKLEIQKWFLAERTGCGVDYFNPDLSRHFLELTHERYRTGLMPEAWAHVEAVFSDEPEFGLGHAFDSLSRHGAVPWTPKLPELFRAKFGEDLQPQIANLFFPRAGAAQTRVKFWELLADVFNDSFTTSINDWCRRQGKLFTAHVKGEEHPLFQVPTNGSCHQFFRRLDLPAIDALERYPGNNYYPCQLSSAARQFGSGRCMAEAFGGAGWGATPEDLEIYLLWLGRHGLTDFVLHLSQYRLDSAALCDWPPSQPLHLTWREAYPEVLQRVRRELEANPRPPADTLVIAPNRGIMAHYTPQEFLQTNVHNAATYPDTAAGKINRRFLAQVEELHRAGVNFDVADERSLEEFGKAAGKKLQLGRCDYQRVIVPEGCELNPAASALAKMFAGVSEAGPLQVHTRRKSCGKEIRAAIPVRWKLETHPLNTLLLQPTVEPDGSFVACFDIAETLGDAKLQLVFADDIASASLNGSNLLLKTSEEGSVAQITGDANTGPHLVRFRPVKNVARPFVWVKGFFRAMSNAPFSAGPNRTITTDGVFSLHPACETMPADLIAGGFPCLQTPLVVGAEIILPQAAAWLRIDGAEADAIRLFVDGLDHGWAWPSTGEIVFEVQLASGVHRLQLELVPNSFNGFGPHHYYLGDWPVISPDQMRGVRNFADAADAPAGTHVSAWHFRRFTLPKGVSF